MVRKLCCAKRGTSLLSTIISSSGSTDWRAIDSKQAPMQSRRLRVQIMTLVVNRLIIKYSLTYNHAIGIARPFSYSIARISLLYRFYSVSVVLHVPCEGRTICVGTNSDVCSYMMKVHYIERFFNEMY